MGAWYWIGVFVGIGVSVGFFSPIRRWPVVEGISAVLVAAAIGAIFKGSAEAIGGGIGAVGGAVGGFPLVAGALRRGGTRGGTAFLVGIAALVLAALAFVPVLGYLEAVALPALGLRVRRRAPDRHAGLRTLTKD
jgi:hypothetical protein